MLREEPKQSCSLFRMGDGKHEAGGSSEPPASVIPARPYSVPVSPAPPGSQSHVARRDLRTTAIYAKADTNRLAVLALSATLEYWQLPALKSDQLRAV